MHPETMRALADEKHATLDREIEAGLIYRRLVQEERPGGNGDCSRARGEPRTRHSGIFAWCSAIRSAFSRMCIRSSSGSTTVSELPYSSR